VFKGVTSGAVYTSAGGRGLSRLEILQRSGWARTCNIGPRQKVFGHLLANRGCEQQQAIPPYERPSAQQQLITKIFDDIVSGRTQLKCDMVLRAGFIVDESIKATGEPETAELRCNAEAFIDIPDREVVRLRTEKETRRE
jgi:hypothetical protein